MIAIGERITPNVRLGLAFGAGSLLGAGVSLLVCRRVLGHKAEARITREVDDVKRHYLQRIQNIQRAHAAALANAVGKGDNPLDGPATVGAGVQEPDADSPSASASRAPGRVEPDGGMGLDERDLEGLYGENDDADEGDLPGWAAGVVPENDRESGDSGEDGEVDGDSDSDTAGQDDLPSGEVPASPVLGGAGRARVISGEEFEGLDENYTKIVLTWFEGDKCLADEDARPIRNYEFVVGKDFASQFKTEEGNPDIVHVANPKLQTAFEILRDERSWTEAHLSYGRPQ